jgi:hypothetical protein
MLAGSNWAFLLHRASPELQTQMHRNIPFRVGVVVLKCVGQLVVALHGWVFRLTHTQVFWILAEWHGLCHDNANPHIN